MWNDKNRLTKPAEDLSKVQTWETGGCAKDWNVQNQLHKLQHYRQELITGVETGEWLHWWMTAGREREQVNSKESEQRARTEGDD